MVEPDVRLQVLLECCCLSQIPDTRHASAYEPLGVHAGIMATRLLLLALVACLLHASPRNGLVPVPVFLCGDALPGLKEYPSEIACLANPCKLTEDTDCCEILGTIYRISAKLDLLRVLHM